MEENQKGATIFFCNHDIGEVQELCGRTAIIRKGSILEVANTDNLSSSDTRRVKLKPQIIYPLCLPCFRSMIPSSLEIWSPSPTAA